MNAIITGANRGIGLETLKLFASKGYNIWACIRKPKPDFQIQIDELSKKYDKFGKQKIGL